MADASFWLRPTNASELLPAMVRAVAAIFPKQLISLKVSTNVVADQFKVDGAPATGMEEHQDFKAMLDVLSKHSFYEIKSAQLEGLQPQGSIVYTVGDGITAKLVIRFGDPDFVRLVPQIAERLAEKLNLTTRDAVIHEAIPDVFKDQVRHYDRAVADLTAAVGRLGDAGTRQIEQQAQFVLDKTSELEKRFSEREGQLAQRFQEKEEDLRRREEAHGTRVREFETRESKYVRRDLLQKMEKRIENQKQVELSQKTHLKRWPIHVACLGTLAGFIVLVAFYAWKNLSAEQPQWHHFLPASIGLLGFSVTLVYYVRWNDRWATEHAQAEFRNMRFGADILRASWLAELLFEWETEKQREFPDRLVDSFTRELFAGQELPLTEHPLDQLTKAVSSIKKLRTGSIEIEK